jgi:hypothetical protein
MLAADHKNALEPLTSTLKTLARRAGVWPRDRRPRVGSVSPSWLREFEAESDKRGVD